MSDKVQNENNTSSDATSAGTISSNATILNGVRGGILGIKSGMTQVYSDDGDLIPVTVLDLQPNFITQVKTKENDGYQAVQVGLLPKKTHRTSKADKGHFKKSGNPGYRFVREFRVNTVDGLREGLLLSPDFVKEGEMIDVTGVSKGKGFQGGMKRYNMAGGHKSHGASLSHRSLGSIGNRADPAKCFKNKKMPGHMGMEKVTMQNLKVIKVDKENNMILVRGSVPGSKNGLVIIQKAVKKLG